MTVTMAKPGIMRVLNNLGTPGGGNATPTTLAQFLETQDVTIDTLIEAGMSGLIMGALPGKPSESGGPVDDVAWWLALVSPPTAMRLMLTRKGYDLIGNPVNRLLVGIQESGGRRMLGQALAGQDSRDWRIAAAALAHNLVTVTARRGRPRYAAGTSLDAGGFEGYVKAAGASEAMFALELQLAKLGRAHLPIR